MGAVTLQIQCQTAGKTHSKAWMMLTTTEHREGWGENSKLCLLSMAVHRY